jgi:hypothetical protein
VRSFIAALATSYIFQGVNGRIMIGLASLVYLLAIIPVLRIDDHKVPTTHFGISASPRMSIDVQRGTGVYALMVSKFLDFLDALKVQFLFAQLESSAINLTVDMS